MVKYLMEQEKILLSALKDDKNLVEAFEYAKVQIAWLSHERLVHLLVTLFISFVLILAALGEPQIVPFLSHPQGGNGNGCHYT